jgi:hypothetical protein
MSLNITGTEGSIRTLIFQGGLYLKKKFILPLVMFLIIFTLIISVFLLNTRQTTVPAAVIPVARFLTIAPSSNITVNLYKTDQIYVNESTTQGHVTDKTQFSISPATIASITQDGIITGNVIGTATLTATYNGETATAKIHVFGMLGNANLCPKSDIAGEIQLYDQGNYRSYDINLAPGQTLQLGGIGAYGNNPGVNGKIPTQAPWKDISSQLTDWHSSDTNVATVSPNGLVTAVGKGYLGSLSATISASVTHVYGYRGDIATVSAQPVTIDVKSGSTP